MNLKKIQFFMDTMVSGVSETSLQAKREDHKNHPGCQGCHVSLPCWPALQFQKDFVNILFDDLGHAAAGVQIKTTGTHRQKRGGKWEQKHPQNRETLGKYKKNHSQM